MAELWEKMQGVRHLLAYCIQSLIHSTLSPFCLGFAVCLLFSPKGFWLPRGRMSLSELPNIPAAGMGARKNFREHRSPLVPLLESSWTRGKASLAWQRVVLSCRARIRQTQSLVLLLFLS